VAPGAKRAVAVVQTMARSCKAETYKANIRDTKEKYSATVVKNIEWQGDEEVVSSTGHEVQGY
jgi:hypothetical protein